MITTYNIDEKKERLQWDQFIEAQKDGTPFHLSSWLLTIRQTYPFKPLLYVLKDSSGNISSVLPLFRIKSIVTGTRIVSVPFSDYCHPLAATEEDLVRLITQLLDSMGRNIKYVEIRGFVSEKAKFVCNNYYKRHFITLPPEPVEMRKKINKRTIQYSIRKAEKAEVTIVEDNSEKGIEEFYRLNLLTRKKHGVPPQPKRFFINMIHNMVSHCTTSILLAKWDSKAIAAGVFFKFLKTVYYKYNVSDPDYLSTKAPNHLLTWKAIETACKEGYRYFDFGRTAPDNEGLMRYKEMWGAEAVDLPYSYYPEARGIGTKEEKGLLYNAITRTWRSMPDAITTRLGPLIYPHLG
jgi:serine/alanine adding enzyme